MPFDTRGLLQPLAALVLLLPALVLAMGKGAVPVVVATAESRELTPLIQVAGTVISSRDTRLAAQVEGQVTWVADVGTVLDTGAVAARLDDVLLRSLLAEQQAQVTRARAELTFQQAEVKRLTELASEKHAAQSRVDQAHRDAGIARSDLAAAQSRVAQTQERLARTTITAPFSGVVTEEFIQAGEWADPGTAMVRLVDVGALEVQGRVPAASLPYITPGSELAFTVAGTNGQGTVIALVPVGDDRSRLYELRLQPTGTALTAGESVRIAIPTDTARRVTVVPRDALVLRRDGTRVFVVREDNTAEQVRVTTGMAQGDVIEVIGDIAPGDRVVVRGGERLRTGQAVEPKDPVPGA